MQDSRNWNAWSDERVEQLKKLWEAGLSASQIAAELGGWPASSPDGGRNAVIGKASRLGLAKRGKSVTVPKERKVKPDKTITVRPRTSSVPRSSAQFEAKFNVEGMPETVPARRPRLKPSPGFMSARERRERGYEDGPDFGGMFPLPTAAGDGPSREDIEFLSKHLYNFG